ncbi:hypothetical protein OG455_27150 [Kitasatospora sp. NBC_01287]|uniref:hypothetical protein n=1 Tax=Kitasatospora sp. NBC_01287 TaxID=2903573 RepID=UPI00225B4A38|nr:hypothetical protein [Kitasatospora sp. NBC_01287]MCX4749141.1 hypothetical protein [Kitasatospora sp. NBC_01287]
MNDPETIGPYTLHPPADHEPTIGWCISTSDRTTWLPGTYDTRDAALLAVGINLGAQHGADLTSLRDTHANERALTVDHITGHDLPAPQADPGRRPCGAGRACGTP